MLSCLNRHFGKESEGVEVEVQFSDDDEGTP